MATTFLFTYRVPKQPLEERLAELDEQGRAARLGAWSAWLENMGSSVIDQGQPVLDATQIGNCEAELRIGGYTLVAAEDFDAAIALAEGCPVIEAGGGVEVGRLGDLPGLTRVEEPAGAAARR
jgi:hypothetical protein